MIILILGTAGSGKTTLAKALREYLEDSILINLDPGNPLNSDIDIRDYVRTEEVMKKYNLGPNSSILKSMEISLDYLEEIINKIPDVSWKIVDTPGQIEVFLHKDYGKKIVKKLKEIDEVAPVFLIDIVDTLDPKNFVSTIAWNVIIYLKLGEKTLTVINKKDLLSKDKIEEIKRKIREFKYFKELESGNVLDYLIAKNFREFYEYSTIYKRPIFISAKTREGFDELISACLELFCICGDIS